MYAKSVLTAVISVVSLFALTSPSFAEPSSRQVRLINIQPVRSGSNQRVYFYSASENKGNLLSFRKELIAKGYRNVNCFYPTLVVCEVPIEESTHELTANTDIVPVREAEISDGAFLGPADDLRRVKQCYARLEESRSVSPRRAPEAYMPDTGPILYDEQIELPPLNAMVKQPAEFRNIQQNSEFLIGDILIQVIYPESMSGGLENWTDQALAAAAQGVQMAILSWQDNYRNIPLHVIFRSFPRANTRMEPITFYQADQGVWIKDVMRRHLGYYNPPRSAKSIVHEFNTDGREAFHTDWVFTAFIVNSENDDDHNFPKAARKVGWSFLGGPYLVSPYPAMSGSSFQLSQVFKHYMAMIFWATHETFGGGSSCATRSGYLNYQNLNKTVRIDDVGGPVGCRGGPPAPCIMNLPFALAGWTDPPCVYSEGMIGLADKNSNYVPDALDAAPIVDFGIARKETIWTDDYELTFQAISQGVPNRNPFQAPENRIDYSLPVKDVSYKVNGVGPIMLQPVDGESDELIEDFAAYLPDLIPGPTEINITTRNTLGSTSGSYKKLLYYMGLSFQHFTFNYSNQGIGISWNMMGELFDATTFDLHRIVSGPEPVDSIIIADVPYTPSGDYFTHLTCFDDDVIPGQKYTYYVEGTFTTTYRDTVVTIFSRSNEFDIIASLQITDKRIFSPPSPNPFRDQTWISIDIPASYRDAGDPNASLVTNPGGRIPAASIQDLIPTHIKVIIYDVLGRPVKNLYKDRIYSTVLTINWDGTNNSSERLPSGIYFMRVVAGPYTQVQKVLILR